MKQIARACLVLLCLVVSVASSTAKPDRASNPNKTASPPPAIDFSELDKLVPEELKEKNTPGAVITVISSDQVVYQMVPSRKFAVIVLTNKSGETMRKSLNKATELGLGLRDDGPAKPPAFAPVTESEMSEYVGVYSHAPNTWDVSVKDGKPYVKFDGKDYPMTKSGEKQFTFGEQNENELVFVPGKSGKIEFLFTELYGAKKIK